MKRTAEFTPNTTPSKIATWSTTEMKTPERRRGPPVLLKASPTKVIQRRSVYSQDFVKTYVFFDLECTGLIKNDDTRQMQARVFEKSDDHYNVLNQLCLETRKDELPHITEMSFMAISRETFDELKAERLKDVQWNEANPDSKRNLARYIPTNTHTRQLNPNMTENEWNEYERLRKSDKRGVLVHSKAGCLRNNTFKEEWPAVIEFLNSLQKPALLIGHNAIKYDLRVIYGELQRNEMLDDYPIPSDVFFMDSYWMSKKLEETIVQELVTVCKYIKFPKIAKEEESLIETEPIVITDSVEDDRSSIQCLPTSSVQTLSSDHPMNILNWDQFSIVLRKRIRKDGFVRTSNGGWTYKHGPNKFGLPLLYEELIGGKYTAHYAQQDAEALMHVCLSYGRDFTQYADNTASAVPF